MSPEVFPGDGGIDGFANIKKPRQNASSIGLDDWNGSIEREADHRVRGVFPDPGESPHLLDSARKASVVSIHNDYCYAVEISRTGVIPETLPGAKDFVFGSARQSGEIGKSQEPLVIVGDHRRDLGLLEHEFGHKDSVRITGPAPREITAMATIPTQQVTTKFGCFELHRCTEITTDFSSGMLNLFLSVIHLC